MKAEGIAELVNALLLLLCFFGCGVSWGVDVVAVVVVAVVVVAVVVG